MTQTHIWVIDAYLFLYVVLTARSREIRWYQATLISLFGFLLALTPFSYPVWAIIQAVGSLFFG
ncbi:MULTISPECIES: hypothetical protein [Streptomyces]|uniref:hypothetical protein n=1 Tax=Streptomyces TaxID=1883 RepID=UPI00073DF4E3|nr:hypothetical protein [Streptomyces sp. EAS-AB2608]MYU29593.1 hypothetical protein [Streptomyces sp. SID7810]BCM69021.1 hypothetical protein EASAB2608_04355 [Streptomyces sp. EAS-AB2608]CUW30652.1 hypothetical protein TUE45_05386 [Streptomyces reticuli]